MNLARVLSSRWFLAALVLVAVLLWAVWQPTMPLVQVFWDQKP